MDRFNLSPIVVLTIAAVGGVLLSGFIISDASATEDAMLPSPAKQVQMGTEPGDVLCREGLVLVIRTNGDPNCVTVQSSERLFLMNVATLPDMKPDAVDTSEPFAGDAPGLVVSMTLLSDTFDAMMADATRVTDDAIDMYVSDKDGAFDAITDGASEYDAVMPYPFVLEFDTMNIVAHGVDPELVGVSGVQAIETGKKTIDEVRADLEDAGSTWIMYTSTNPATGKEQIKKSYVKLHEGYVFGSGFYLNDLEAEMIVARWVANSAADLYEEQGTAAFDVITDGATAHDGSEIYPFAGDIDTKRIVAHGADSSLIGDESTILYGNANKMVDQILAESAANGGTWVSYEFTNFETGKSESKVSWLTVRDNYMFGAGFYPDDFMADVIRAIMSVDMALAMYAANGDDAFADITALNMTDSWYPFVLGYEDMVEYADGSVLDRTGAPVWEPYEHNASMYGIRDTLEAGQGAFATYVFFNPGAKEDQAKKSWYVLHDGYIFGAGVYLTGEHADMALAKWSATKALELYREHGTDAFDAINAMGVTDETYPFVFDSDFVIVANGADIQYVGTGVFELITPDKGEKQLRADLAASGHAPVWIEYEFVHPETGEMDAAKTAVLYMHDGYVFGAGYYPVVPYVISGVEFTAEESAWLDAHPAIKVAYDGAWPPYEYVDESGRLAGITGVMAEIFSEAAGSKFEKAVSIETWNDALESMRDGTADVMLMVENTESRGAYMDFTDVWLVIPVDIIVLEDSVDSIAAETLTDYNVVTVKGYAVEDWLDANMPDLEYTSVDTASEALGMVGNGTADAYLDPWASASRLAMKFNITGLANSGPLGYSYNLSIAYTDGDLVLGSILQKLLDAMPEDDRLDIIDSAISAAD